MKPSFLRKGKDVKEALEVPPFHRTLGEEVQHFGLRQWLTRHLADGQIERGRPLLDGQRACDAGERWVDDSDALWRIVDRYHGGRMVPPPDWLPRVDRVRYAQVLAGNGDGPRPSGIDPHRRQRVDQELAPDLTPFLDVAERDQVAFPRHRREDRLGLERRERSQRDVRRTLDVSHAAMD